MLVIEDISNITLVEGQQASYEIINDFDEDAIAGEYTPIVVRFQYNGNTEEYFFALGREDTQSDSGIPLQVHYDGDRTLTFIPTGGGITLDNVRTLGTISVYGFNRGKSKVQALSKADAMIKTFTVTEEISVASTDAGDVGKFGYKSRDISGKVPTGYVPIVAIREAYRNTIMGFVTIRKTVIGTPLADDKYELEFYPRYAGAATTENWKVIVYCINESLIQAVDAT